MARALASFARLAGLLVVLGMVAGCARTPGEIAVSARIDGRSVVLHAAGASSFGGREIRVLDGATPTAARLGPDRHPWALVPLVELRNLPESWSGIAVEGAPGPIARAPAAQGPPAAPAPLAPDGRGRLPLFLVAVAALCAVVFTTSPKDGERSFVVHLFHLVVFLTLCRAWQRDLFWGYLGLLGAAFIATFVSIVAVQEKRQGMLWALRATMLVLYAGMFAILASEPERVSSARRAGEAAIEVYPRSSRRGGLELLDPSGKALLAEKLDPALDAPVLLFWSGPEAPATVRIVAPDGAAEVLALD